MLTLISGSNGSGKSRFAESLVAQMGHPRYYLATMIPYGTPGAERVEKHRRQREGLAFTTVETPFLEALPPMEERAVVLLEDVSNLLANRFFEKKQDWKTVLADILNLNAQVGELLLVTISGYTEGEYSGETAEYINALNALNAALGDAADRVYEMRDGNPVCRKGEAL